MKANPKASRTNRPHWPLFVSMLILFLAWQLRFARGEEVRPVRDVSWARSSTLSFPLELRCGDKTVWIHNCNPANVVWSSTKTGPVVEKWEKMPPEILSSLWRIEAKRVVTSSALKLNFSTQGTSPSLKHHVVKSGLPPYFEQLPLPDRIISVVPLALIYRDSETGEDSILARHVAYVEFMATGNPALLTAGVEGTPFISSSGIRKDVKVTFREKRLVAGAGSARVKSRTEEGAEEDVEVRLAGVDARAFETETRVPRANVRGSLNAAIPYSVNADAFRQMSKGETKPVVAMAVEIPVLQQTLTVSGRMLVRQGGEFDYILVLDNVFMEGEPMQAAFEDVRKKLGTVRGSIIRDANQLQRILGRIGSLEGLPRAGLVTVDPSTVVQGASAVVQLNMAATALDAARNAATAKERALQQRFQLYQELGYLSLFLAPLAAGEVILQYAVLKDDKVVVLGANY